MKFGTKNVNIANSKKIMPLLKQITFFVIIIFITLIIISIFWIPSVSLTHVALMHYKTSIDFPNLFANWDGNNYIEIAERGYQENLPHLYGFMPLYPILIRIITLVLIYPILAAMTISLIALILTLWLLWHLIKLETRDEKLSWRTILYLLIFPTSFFFFVAYTESLFLLLSIGAFYFLKKKHVFLSALLTTLATITRINGILLIPFVGWGIWKLNFIPLTRRIMVIFILPLALILFMAYLNNTTGDPLRFIHAQQSNFQTTTLHNPLKPLVSYLLNFSFTKMHSQLDFIYLLDFCVASITPLLLYVASKKLPQNYILYGITMWLLHMTTGKTNSISRYMLIIFPLFAGLGVLGKRYLFDLGYKITSFGLLIILFMWFLVGNWVA